jgi:hypothetical protein
MYDKRIEIIISDELIFSPILLIISYVILKLFFNNLKKGDCITIIVLKTEKKPHAHEAVSKAMFSR